MRRVSLFDKSGQFAAYVHVRGTPRVVLFKGIAYLAFGDFGTTNSFREVSYETATA